MNKKKFDPEKLSDREWLETYMTPLDPQLHPGLEWCVNNGFGSYGIDDMQDTDRIKRDRCTLYNAIGVGMQRFCVQVIGEVTTGNGDVPKWHARITGSYDTQLDKALRLSGICGRVYTASHPYNALEKLTPVMRKLTAAATELRGLIGEATSKTYATILEHKI